LLLFALARAGRREPRLIRFNEAEPALRRLLRRYGRPGRTPSPSYPFWYLRNDGLWELNEEEELPRRAGSKEPQLTALRERGIGGFPEWAYELVSRDSRFRRRLVRLVLSRHFPRSLHGEICAELGLPALSAAATTRDAQFRAVVLRAYQGRCAVCGFDARLDHQPFGIDAAHLMWVQAGGPCTVPNGLALCALHHRALDRGAIGVSEERTVLVSTDLSGDPGSLARTFYEYLGRPLQPPQNRVDLLDAEFARWHREEVFRAPPREA
jgi:putative restriction endonuclease